MTLSGFTSVVNRRLFVTVALGASLFLGSNAWAQAAAAPAAQEDGFKFSTDSGLMIYSIAPDKTADFEAMWAAIRTKLVASPKPELKALGESLKIFKATSTPQAGQGQTYFFIADPASKTNTYALIWLLYQSELFTRTEADALFNKIGVAAFLQTSALAVTKLP